MASKETINYYDTNAADYTASTSDVDISAIQTRFLDKLPEKAIILDFGCGTGRDSKAFLERGFYVDAIDGSEEMCRIAATHTGIPVKQMYFQDLEDVDKYDGIWSCASILHLSREELVDVLQRMTQALKKNGIIYTSFKYGTFEGERNGRYFTDMTEETFGELIKQISELKIEEEWITPDVRKEQSEEKWLNLILCKTY